MTEREKMLSIYQKNGLYVISGPTGSGKTTLAIRICDELSQQGKSIIFIQGKAEKTIANILSSAMVEVLADDLSIEKPGYPDIIVIDDVPPIPGYMCDKLVNFTRESGCKILLLQQTSMDDFMGMNLITTQYFNSTFCI